MSNYLSAKFGAAVAEAVEKAGTNAYANKGAFPATGNNVGDYAFASDNKGLYIWDGTKWQRLFSGPDETLAWTTEASTSYALEADGSTTTITTAASDPEGFPIEYSYQLTPASPNQVTSVVNNNNGTFTLTPSTNTAHTGTFTLRTIASDGLYNVSKNSSIALNFGVTAEVLLIGGGGSGGMMQGTNYPPGGGGAGGIVYATGVEIGPAHTVTIGAGGAALFDVPARDGNTGGSTSISLGSTVKAIAYGGGYGTKAGSGSDQGGGGLVGSGGGSYNAAAAASTSVGQIGGVAQAAGYAGGTATGANDYRGGGGGGAGGVGVNGHDTLSVAGRGGPGSNTYAVWAAATSTGVGGYYAGGGSGGIYNTGYAVNGGSGGGGGIATDGTGGNGTANTGSGGSAGGKRNVTGKYSGAGGSGLVIVRYSGTPVLTGGTITQSGGYTYHAITSTGTIGI